MTDIDELLARNGLAIADYDCMRELCTDRHHGDDTRARRWLDAIERCLVKADDPKLDVQSQVRGMRDALALLAAALVVKPWAATRTGQMQFNARDFYRDRDPYFESEEDRTAEFIRFDDYLDDVAGKAEARGREQGVRECVAALRGDCGKLNCMIEQAITDSAGDYSVREANVSKLTVRERALANAADRLEVLLPVPVPPALVCPYAAEHLPDVHCPFCGSTNGPPAPVETADEYGPAEDCPLCEHHMPIEICAKCCVNTKPAPVAEVPVCGVALSCLECGYLPCDIRCRRRELPHRRCSGDPHDMACDPVFRPARPATRETK